ncbi:hypothetical protein CALCODRAFT_491212 [Calocera cornea HHB12733]|uniref:Putative ER transporter 6TM N-terminal domain-containing protein n=1 Tax=Calocera cornea HHB12733 TaxID=1353952 RepID=A0A165J5R2_9BASI|nr:hypothetical protein CALCODRAFT_491212 [Calocera cornea HHB12733]
MAGATTKKLGEKLLRRLKGALKFIFSKRIVPTIKGLLAYIILIILSFIFGFIRLNPFPMSLPSAVIISIASVPGNTIGSCVQNTFLNLMGVLVGSLNFFILGKLAQWPVAQGVVFAFIVYLLGLVYAQGLTFLGFALLGILQSFTGIFTSLANGGEFQGDQLRGWMQAYAFGCACVLVVNIFFLPRTSEHALRETMVSSLDHARTLQLLINKGYTEDLSGEERAVMEKLVDSLRTDFMTLKRLLGETTFEVSWSRWSMADYRSLVDKMRSMQGMLIASYYGFLTGEENHSIDTFKEQFLPGAAEEFRQLRRSLCLTFGEIMQEIAAEPLQPLHADSHYGETDIEKQPVVHTSSSDASTEGDEMDPEQGLRAVGRRLQREALVSDGVLPARPTGEIGAVPPEITPRGPSLVDQQLVGRMDARDNQTAFQPYESDAVKSLRYNFDGFAKKELDLIAHLLVSGGLSVDLSNDSLNLFRPLRSIAQSWGTDRVRGIQEVLDKERIFQGPPTGDEYRSSVATPRIVEPEDDPDALRTGHTIVRVYSVLFAINRLMNKLQAMHTQVLLTPKGTKRHYGLQIHILEMFKRPSQKEKLDEEANWDDDMNLQEAICALERREYVPEKVTTLQRLLAVERWFRSPTSVYAFKIVLALSIFSVLIYAPLVRGWFISYALITGLPNLVLALAPTLGGTFLSFGIQIVGTVIGNIAAMVILLIFRNVGGWLYNPYGIICLLAVYALPFAYMVHEMPQLFIFSLLAMNSCGATIVTVYVNAVYGGDSDYNTPPFMAAIGLAALAVALGIVFCFQLLILRSPARHALRIALAAVIEDHLAYVTMLQAYCRSLELVDPSDAPDPKIVRRVEGELKRREAKIQARILDLGQLIGFASLEPNWQKPFRKEAAAKLLRANQLLLDRWSETRSAVGNEPFPPFVSQQFVSILSPYRRQCYTVTKTSLYLAATSMASKIPLPIETPNPGRLASDLVHDALLLSSRYAKTDEGREIVKTGDFARYWFFLLVNMSALTHVANIEDACREIYGTFEDKMQ